MLKLSTKFFIVVEVILCFGPATILVLIGTVLVPIQFGVVGKEPVDWRPRVELMGSVACGVVGLATLVYFLQKLFSNDQRIGRPILVCTGIALGLLPLVPAVLPEVSFRWIGLLPIAATIHILFLGRRMMFVSYKEAVKCIFSAAAIAIALPTLLELFPFGSSEGELERQRDIWIKERPAQYEYTIQLSGGSNPELLYPKRVIVVKGETTSATNAWSDHKRQAGDPAPFDSFWTVERVFDELLEAKRGGQTVVAGFNHRSGYVENASVYGGKQHSSWGMEIREFQALDSESSLPN